jgi:1,4-dihydroxy-2-naphthoyl-CoA hydrolase
MELQREVDMKRPIWFKQYQLEDANRLIEDTMIDRLGIKLIGIGDDYLRGQMPVNRFTRQPMGLLHGGASLAFAETLSAIGANWVIDPSSRYCVGLEINANHLRQISDGMVIGVARPLHLGRSTQVWEVRITDEKHRPVCISRATLAVLALAD